MEISAAASLSALDALALSQQVAAHNLANLNTEEFRPSRAILEERPDLGGAAVQEVRQAADAPPLVPILRLAEGEGGVEQEPAPAPGSGVDPAREMVELLRNQRAFEANAAVVRARDELAGTVLDITA